MVGNTKTSHGSHGAASFSANTRNIQRSLWNGSTGNIFCFCELAQHLTQQYLISYLLIGQRHRLEDSALVKSDIQYIVNNHLDMYLPDVEPTPMLSQVKEEEEEDVLFDETRLEYFPVDGRSSEDAASGGLFSEGAMSEEPISGGMLSEGILLGGLLSEEG